MPKVFFNTEIGCAGNHADGVSALLKTAVVYEKMQKHCSHLYKESPDVLSVYLVKDAHGFKYSFGDCFRSLAKEDREKTMLMIHCLNRSTTLTFDVFEDIEGWYVDQLEVHSPLMEYTVKQKGMLLTIAVTQCWMHDFFTFGNYSPEKLPNLWGQEDVASIEQWLEVWYRNYNAPLEEFVRCCDDVILCPRSLPENDFSVQIWQVITYHFVRARQRSYSVDNRLIKDLSPHRTKHGLLHELRLHSEGIRVLFALHEGKPIVGGYYFYGTGLDKVRDDNHRTAITRINAHS